MMDGKLTLVQPCAFTNTVKKNNEQRAAKIVRTNVINLTLITLEICMYMYVYERSAYKHPRGRSPLINTEI